MNRKKEKYLDKISDYCFQKLEDVNNDTSKLNPVLQTVIAIYSAQGIIDNGGFQYFFENDFPQNPSYSFFSDSYRTIGADKAADNIDKAIQLFGFQEPHKHIEQRIQFLEQNDNEELPFHKLGDEICGDDSIWEKLADYTMENKEVFEIPYRDRDAHH